MPWHDVNLANGDAVQFYEQEFQNECGPSCVATVLRLLGKTTDITQARAYVGKVDPTRPPGVPVGQHDWNLDYANMDSLSHALSNAGIKSAYMRKFFTTVTPALNFSNFCEARAKNKPAILRIAHLGALGWDGGHFIVTVGRNGAPAPAPIEILDPGSNGPVFQVNIAPVAAMGPPPGGFRVDNIPNLVQYFAYNAPGYIGWFFDYRFAVEV